MEQIPGFVIHSPAENEVCFDSIVEILRHSRASITTSDERSIHTVDDDTITRLNRIVKILSTVFRDFVPDDNFGKIVGMLLWYGWDRAPQTISPVINHDIRMPVSALKEVAPA